MWLTVVSNEHALTGIKAHYSTVRKQLLMKVNYILTHKYQFYGMNTDVTNITFHGVACSEIIVNIRSCKR